MSDPVALALIAAVAPTLLALAALRMAMSNARRIDRHMEVCPKRPPVGPPD